MAFFKRRMNPTFTVLKVLYFGKLSYPKSNQELEFFNGPTVIISHTLFFGWYCMNVLDQQRSGLARLATDLISTVAVLDTI